MFQRAITALVTPFDGGKIAENTLRELIWFQCAEGTHALVVCGTTGEGITLDAEERRHIISAAKEESKIPVIVSTGDVCVKRAIEKTLEAERLGADGVLVVTPYYNCPSQEGLCRYFERVAESTSLPLILYHHPRRTGVSLTFESFERLSRVKNIVGVKEASGNVSLILKILHHLPEWTVLAGDDAMILPLMAIGAKGGISVLGNLFPSKIKELISKQEQGVLGQIYPFLEGVACDVNPVPIKAMMELAGLCTQECRPPLAPLSHKDHLELKELVLSSPLVPGAVYE